MDQVWDAISALVRPLLTLSYLISVHALKRRMRERLGQKGLYDGEQFGKQINDRGYYTKAQLAALDIALTAVELSLLWFLAALKQPGGVGLMRGVEAELQEDPAALVIGTGGQPVLEHVGRPRLVGRRSRALGHKKSPPFGLDYSTEGGTGQEKDNRSGKRTNRPRIDCTGGAEDGSKKSQHEGKAQHLL